MLRLLRAGADEGRAVVMVTHEAAAAGIADRVLHAPGAGSSRRDRARRRRAARAPRRARCWPRSGCFAAALVVGTGVTVGYGLGTGFDRAADRADLPDVIARFSRRGRGERIDAARAGAAQPRGALLPLRGQQRGARVAPTATRARARCTSCSAAGAATTIVEGHDLSRARGEVVIERGLAREWDLHPGDTLDVGRSGALRIAGIAVSPDNVAYPLAKARARLRVDARSRPLGFALGNANLALLWLARPGQADVTLTQARAVSFGIGRLEFITRDGVRVLLAQAAGIVISLLVAFSLVALAAAGTMLAAGAHADVQRRLTAFGVQRALGFTPARIAALQAVEARARRACRRRRSGSRSARSPSPGPAAACSPRSTSCRPGAALLGPLAARPGWSSCSSWSPPATWPAWRAARRPPAEILRGGDLAAPAGAGRSARGGLLGARRALRAPPRGRAGSPRSRRSPSAPAWSR